MFSFLRDKFYKKKEVKQDAYVPVCKVCGKDRKDSKCLSYWDAQSSVIHEKCVDAVADNPGLYSHRLQKIVLAFLKAERDRKKEIDKVLVELKNFKR